MRGIPGIFIMLKRCICMSLTIALLLLCAVPAHAAGKLIAAVLTSDLARYKEAHRAFVKALIQKGYDQRNIEIIVQTPNPDPISWVNSVRKVSALGADIIVSYGAPITLTAAREAETIPIVFVDVYGPVETGISRSMSMTGRNMSGVSSKVPMATLIKTVSDIKHIKTIGVFYNSHEAGSVVQLKEIKRLAARQGFDVIELSVSTLAGLEAALTSLLPQVDCVYVSESSAVSRGIDRIVARANAHKVPVISQIPDSSEKGVLVALEVNQAEQGQLAAEFAAKILAGNNPAQMPVSTPKKIELIINMRAAKALDIQVPFQVLSVATKIVK